MAATERVPYLAARTCGSRLGSGYTPADMRGGGSVNRRKRTAARTTWSLVALVMSLVGFAGVCQASVFTVMGYRLNYGTLIVSGTFEYDATLQSYSNWNLTSDWSSMGYGVFTYTNANSWWLPTNYWGNSTIGPQNFFLRASTVPSHPQDAYRPGELWLNFSSSLATLAPGQSTAFNPGEDPRVTGNYDARGLYGGYESYAAIYGTATREQEPPPEVPEPASLVVVSLLLGSLGLIRRNRRK